MFKYKRLALAAGLEQGAAHPIAASEQELAADVRRWVELTTSAATCSLA
mgnify:CR=1 FL=1